MIKIPLNITAEQSWLALWLVLAVAPLAISAHVNAATTNAISQNYQASTSDIGAGALISLNSTSQETVGLANSSNLNHLVGIASSKALLELSENGNTSVPVVVDGSAQALVSDMNGAIKTGDKITASPVNGIGMKATASGEVVGTAEADLASIKTINQTVQNKSGKNTTIHVGLLQVAVNVTYYTVPQKQGNFSYILPPFLQDLANNISGRSVAPLRVLVGAMAIILGFTAVTVMLYSSIRANITSIGRNPMAESSLRKALVDVAFAAVSVLIVSAAMTYIVLVT